MVPVVRWARVTRFESQLSTIFLHKTSHYFALESREIIILEMGCEPGTT